MDIFTRQTETSSNYYHTAVQIDNVILLNIHLADIMEKQHAKHLGIPNASIHQQHVITMHDASLVSLVALEKTC